MAIARLLLVALGTAAVLASTAAASTAATAKDAPVKATSADELIQQGTALHDAGDYDAAIARYQQALALEPDNDVAIYELAFAYDARKDYDRCVETARRGLRLAGAPEPRLYSVAGSCLDDAGKGEEAAAMYRQGLAKHPGDGHLGYNLAVTLWRAEKNDDAVAQLLSTIAAEPTFASPYLLLGTIDHQQGRDVPALFALLRYLMVDHQSDRSQQTAVMALGLFLDGVTTKPGSGDDATKTEITVAMPADEGGHDGILSTLALSRQLAVAAMFTDDNAGKSEGARQAAALDDYLAIASELAAASDNADSIGTPEWKLTGAQVAELHDRGVALAFGYLVAERAGVPGAGDWLAANPGPMRQLESALAAPDATP